MEKIEDKSEIQNIKYFVPHHAIIKPSSTTTKLRVVFDASAKTTTKTSLNDTLMVGATVQEDLASIILRFRKHRYVFTADIEKMYRQVNVNNEHTYFQCILWRDSIHKPIEHYKLKTAADPFLATRTLKQLAIDESHRFPKTSKAALSDFYVDDILSGANSVNDVISLQKELTAMLNAGGMHLRKWCSNCPELLKNIPQCDLELVPTNDDNSANSTIKTLGIIWNPSTDNLSFKIHKKLNLPPFTKRKVISDIASLFDPLGLLSPVIVKAKMFMQTLWSTKVDWDTPLSNGLQNYWSSYSEMLEDVRILETKRCMLSTNMKSV